MHAVLFALFLLGCPAADSEAPPAEAAAAPAAHDPQNDKPGDAPAEAQPPGDAAAGGAAAKADGTADEKPSSAAPDAGKPPPGDGSLYGWDDNVGAVSSDPDGAVCWKLAGDPPEGAPVTVAALHPKVVVHSATVVGRCDPGADPLMLGDKPSPRVRLKVEGLGKDAFAGIAILGAPRLRADGDDAAGEIDGDGKDEALAVCRTGEGLMLSAWKGKARKGKKVWSAYHFLGGEAKSTCTDGEVN